MSLQTECRLLAGLLLLWFFYSTGLFFISNNRGVFASCLDKAILMKWEYRILIIGSAFLILLSVHFTIAQEIEQINFFKRCQSCTGHVINADVEGGGDSFYVKVKVDYEVEGKNYSNSFTLPGKGFSSKPEATCFLNEKMGGSVEIGPWTMIIYYDPQAPDLASLDKSLHGGSARFIPAISSLVVLAILLALHWNMARGKVVVRTHFKLKNLAKDHAI